MSPNSLLFFIKCPETPSTYVTNHILQLLWEFVSYGEPFLFFWVFWWIQRNHNFEVLDFFVLCKHYMHRNQFKRIDIRLMEQFALFASCWFRYSSANLSISYFSTAILYRKEYFLSGNVSSYKTQFCPSFQLEKLFPFEWIILDEIHNKNILPNKCVIDWGSNYKAQITSLNPRLVFKLISSMNTKTRGWCLIPSI